MFLYIQQLSSHLILYHTTTITTPPSVRVAWGGTLTDFLLELFNIYGIIYIFRFFVKNVSTRILATLPKDFSESNKGTLIKSIFKTCGGASTPSPPWESARNQQRSDVKSNQHAVMTSVSNRIRKLGLWLLSTVIKPLENGRWVETRREIRAYQAF